MEIRRDYFKMNTFDYSQFIKTEAKNLGFFSCGISKAEFLEDEAPRLEKWLKEEIGRASCRERV